MIKFKYLICTATRTEGARALTGLGEHGHIMTVVKRNGWSHGAVTIHDDNVAPYIMHKECRRKYSASPDDCIYTDFQPRKKMINAYEKLALRYWCNSRKKARAWARGYVDQCYFWKNGKMSNDLELLIADWYPGFEGSQADFDEIAYEDLRNW